MNNPFLLNYSNEAGLKEGLDNDGALTAANNEPLQENPFLQEPVKLKKKEKPKQAIADTPIEKPTFGAALKERAIGTALDVGDLLGSIPGLITAPAAAIGTGLAGGGNDAAVEAMKEQAAAFTPRSLWPERTKDFPVNPALEKAMEGITWVAKNASESDPTYKMLKALRGEQGQETPEDFIRENAIMAGMFAPLVKGKPKGAPKPTEVELARQLADEIRQKAQERSQERVEAGKELPELNKEFKTPEPADLAQRLKAGENPFIAKEEPLPKLDVKPEELLEGRLDDPLDPGIARDIRLASQEDPSLKDWFQKPDEQHYALRPDQDVDTLNTRAPQYMDADKLSMAKEIVEGSERTPSFPDMPAHSEMTFKGGEKHPIIFPDKALEAAKALANQRAQNISNLPSSMMKKQGGWILNEDGTKAEGPFKLRGGLQRLAGDGNGDYYRFAIDSADGKKTPLRISGWLDKETGDFYVDWVGSKDLMDFSPTNQVGAKDMAQIGKALVEQLPEIQSISGMRIGGTRAKAEIKALLEDRKTSEAKTTVKIPPSWRKKQGGWIDIGGPEEAAYDKGRGQKDYFETAEELLKAHPVDTTKDMGSISGSMAKAFTNNQVGEMMKSPWFKFAFRKIGQAKREANVRFGDYADRLKSVYALKRAQQLELFKKLEDIQDPDLYAARKAAEQTNSRERFLLYQGMPPALVPEAIKVLDVLKEVYEADNHSTVRVGREAFDYEPMYFPRAFSGPYNLVVRDSQGRPYLAQGFNSITEAQTMRRLLADQLDGDNFTITLDRQKVGNEGDIFSVMAMEHGTPEFMQKIVGSMEKDIEIAKRKFELERSRQGVKGYIGEVLGDESTLKGRFKNDDLLNLLQNRLKASWEWEVKSKIIKDIKEPFFDDITILHDKPTLRHYMAAVVNRELGHDLSAVAGFDRFLQHRVEDLTKQVDKMFGAIKGYEGGDIALISPKGVARTAQWWTAFTSTMKLGLSMPVLAANATAIPLVGLDGVRTAAKYGHSQVVPVAAYLDTLGYMGHKSQGATKFMQTALKEGMVEPHIADTYDLAQTSQVHAEGAISHVINYPRNMIEKGTNFVTILYYYHYWKRQIEQQYKGSGVEVDTTSEGFKQKVYESARSWTGDYSTEALPVVYSEAGTVGRLTTNFSKWKWNQMGRLVDDLRDAKGGNFTPMLVNVATTVLMAGVFGMPLVVDYEAFRRLGKATGLWDWRPVSGWLDELENKTKIKAPDWVRSGAITSSMDSMSKELGVTAPDLSGTLRHGSAFEAPTVAFTYAKDVFVDALPVLAKMSWEAAGGKTKGVTDQDTKELIGALPNSLQSLVKNATIPGNKDPLMAKKLSNGNYVSEAKFGNKGAYERTPQEQALAAFGFKSMDEARFTERTFYNQWLKANRKREISEATQGILNNYNNPELLQRNVNILYNFGGATTVKNLISQLEKDRINPYLSEDDQEIYAILSSNDPVRKALLIKELKALLASKSQRTSSNH